MTVGRTPKETLLFSLKKTLRTAQDFPILCDYQYFKNVPDGGAEGTYNIRGGKAILVYIEKFASLCKEEGFLNTIYSMDEANKYIIRVINTILNFIDDFTRFIFWPTHDLVKTIFTVRQKYYYIEDHKSDISTLEQFIYRKNVFIDCFINYSGVQNEDPPEPIPTRGYLVQVQEFKIQKEPVPMTTDYRISLNTLAYKENERVRKFMVDFIDSFLGCVFKYYILGLTKEDPVPNNNYISGNFEELFKYCIDKSEKKIFCFWIYILRYYYEHTINTDVLKGHSFTNKTPNDTRKFNLENLIAIYNKNAEAAGQYAAWTPFFSSFVS